ncbi:hypothetical protein JCM8547_003537 [Rhodosporidiobolus lusitaniae]
MATLDTQPSFLRATAQRAGSLVLWAPRRAMRTLPSSVQDYIPSAVLGHASTSEHAPATPPAPPVDAAPPAAPPSSPSSSAASLPIPSPLSFMYSSYLFTALALAFFLHRIHHLVPPRTRAAFAGAGGNVQLRRVLSPLCQIGCRSPGMLLMMRNAAGMAVAIALSGGNELAWLNGTGEGQVGYGKAAVRAIGKVLVWVTAWAGKGTFGAFLAGGVDIDHPSLLWQAFLSIALSLVCETFTRALSDDLPSVHHFNLLSFAFLLHVHSASSPSSSSNTATGAVAANKELYIYLLLTLCELITLQSSYCLPFLRSSPRNPHPRSRRRAPARAYRLPITLVYSLLAQFFAVRSWIRLFTPPSPGSVAAEAVNSGRRAGELEVFSTIWLNKVPEVCFEIIVGASLGLKALAALIRGDEMTLDNIVGPPASAYDREEDYAVALIKYTTHLLSTTRLSGLALELSPLEVLPLSVSTPLASLGLLPPSADHLSDAEYAAQQQRELEALGGAGTGVVLRANGEVWFDEPVPVSELRQRAGGRRSSVSQPTEQHSLGQSTPDGFANEIRRVTIEDRHHPFPSSEGEIDLHSYGGSVVGGAEMVHLEGHRKHVLWRFILLCARIVLYLGWSSWTAVRGVVRGLWMKVRGRGRELELEREWRANELRRERRRSRGPSPEIRREDEEEDDGGEYVPAAEDEDDEGWTSGSEDGENDGYRSSRATSPFDDSIEIVQQEEEEDDLSNPLALFSDLSRPPTLFSRASRPNPPSRSTSTDLVLSSAPPASATAGLTPEDLAPYLLAHHLSSSSAFPFSPGVGGGGMLTRRRYRALLPGGSPSSSAANFPPSPSPHHHAHQHHHLPSHAAQEHATSSAILDRRSSLLSGFAAEGSRAGANALEVMEKKREEWREGRSRFCVVCTVEERSVVLWPCRCLCLCDGCRTALADRTTGSAFAAEGGQDGAQQSGGGICPTCRTPVVGFSRIYIP